MMKILFCAIGAILAPTIAVAVIFLGFVIQPIVTYYVPVVWQWIFILFILPIAAFGAWQGCEIYKRYARH